MPLSRNIDSMNFLQDWTDSIEKLPNQYGYFNSRNFFSTKGVTQKSIQFEYEEHTNTLIPTVDSKVREKTVGKDRARRVHSLPLLSYGHKDRITSEDIQGQRAFDTPDGLETVSSVYQDKLMDGRQQIDLTYEYLQIQAAKGVSVTPDGVIQADMFDEMGVTQKTIDFDLGNNNVDLSAKIQELKFHIGENLTGFNMTGNPEVLVDNTFFNRLRNNGKYRANHLNSAANQELRRDAAKWMQFGIMSSIEIEGIVFHSYQPSFTLPDGTTTTAFDEASGLVITPARGLYRGYYGPSTKLAEANKQGRRIFAYEYSDPRGEYLEMEFQFSPLFFITKPSLAIKVFTAT